MKKILRFTLGLWLALAIAACSAFPDLPTIPPGWTRTPSLTPTPAATSTPTITPTPMPNARVNVGDLAFFNGDYDTALLHYSIALQDSPDPLIRAGAKWGEAKIYYAQERYIEARNALQALINEYPQSPHAAQAYFLLGFVHYRTENYPAAAEAWGMYSNLRPNHLDAYAQELRGDALFGARDYAGALDAYTAAIQSPSLDDKITLDMKVASTHNRLGNYDTALAVYDGVIARTPLDVIKAQATYESGLIYQTVGQREAALEKFLFAVENYQRAYYSYLSLIALLDMGGSVSELDRGLVDYFAGQHVVAIAAFDRYLASNPPENDGTAYYYRALSRRSLSFFDEALQDYSTFIENYPAHPRWGDAWGEKAFLEWAQKGNYTQAAETMLRYVQAAPNTNLASDYLMSAARIYERDGQNDKATETWARVANEYPGTMNAANAVFLMGVIYYRDGNYTSALEAFNRSLVLSESAREQSRAFLWMGKSQEKLGNMEAAANAWREGQNRNPGGYYSERARDMLLERDTFAPASSVNLAPDIQAAKNDADTWMRLTFNLTPDVDLDGLGPLGGDARVVRGREYWDMAMFERARNEFENLRLELERNQDAVGSYRLANYLLELGLYRPAIFAARQVLTIAGMTDHAESMLAPVWFSYVRYGLYYSNLVLPEAQNYRLDPLLVFSVMRQESLFEGFAVSTASARGLMQVIPTTGAQIAGELGKPLNYSDRDLYRPAVSVMFGTYYLNKNRNLFEGDQYAMLAAYNGGAGNTLQWKALAGDDPDLLLESVRFEETRNYIRNIYEIFIIYKRLYGAAEQ